MLGNRKTSVRVFQYGNLLASLPQRLKDGIPVGTGEPVRISLCDACGESDGLRPAIHEGLRPGNGFAAGTAAATHKTDDGAVTQRLERAGLLFDCGEVARSRTEIFRLLAADNAYFHVNSLMSGVKKGRGFPPLAFTGKRGFPIWPQQSGQGRLRMVTSGEGNASGFRHRCSILHRTACGRLRRTSNAPSSSA